jgi:hypothetical protein
MCRRSVVRLGGRLVLISRHRRITVSGTKGVCDRVVPSTTSRTAGQGLGRPAPTGARLLRPVRGDPDVLPLERKRRVLIRRQSLLVSRVAAEDSLLENSALCAELSGICANEILHSHSKAALRRQHLRAFGVLICHY